MLSNDKAKMSLAEIAGYRRLRDGNRPCSIKFSNAALAHAFAGNVGAGYSA